MTKKVENIGNMTPKEIMKTFGVSKPTAYRAVKRGYLCPHYHRREVMVGDIDIPFFVSGEAYRFAWAVVWREWPDIAREDYPLAQDMVSEGVYRMIEVSGHPSFKDEKWRWVVTKRACQGFLKSKKTLARNENADDEFPTVSYMDMVETSLNKELWLSIYFELSQKEIKEIEAFLSYRRPRLSRRLREKILTLMAKNGHEQKEV